MSSAQPLPLDLDAEGCVLNACFFDETGLAIESARSALTPESFYSVANKNVFEAICECRDEGLNSTPWVVAGRLRDKGKLQQVGGIQYLTEVLGTAHPAVLDVESHIKIVRDKARLRRAIARMSELRAEALGDLGANGVQAFLERVETEFGEIAHAGAATRMDAIKGVMSQVMDSSVAARDRGSTITGVPSGFDLDQLTSGLQDGDLRIVGGRPGSGKSSFVVAEARRIAAKGYAVAFFSVEMPELQLGFRMASQESGIEASRLRAGNMSKENWQTFTEATSTLGALPIWFDDDSSLTLATLRAQVRRLMMEIEKGKHPAVTQNRVGAIFIDYLQLMQSPLAGQKFVNREAEVSAISRGLKRLAKEFDLPVTAVASLNRAVEQRGDKRPTLADLRDSGAIESDADCVVFLYRDEYYYPDSDDKGTAELIVAKQRNGPTGMRRLRFDDKTTRFDNHTVDSALDDLYDPFQPGT